MEMRQVGIHTICYAPGMAAAVDPAFLPFDVTADPQAERRETAHMLSFWRQGLHRQYRASGLLSPAFAKKTGFDGKMFNGFIDNNPDFDVWFVNPRPALFYLSYNIWEQGELCHPGLCERAAQVFKAANIEIDLGNFPRSTKGTLLFSNFWVGTARFWDLFMPFVEHISKHAEKIAGVTDQAFYFGIRTSYWPFLFERLFTTFLLIHPEIRTRYIDFELPHILETSMSKIQTLLIREWAPMIDRWDAAGIYSEDQRSIFRGLQKLELLGRLDGSAELEKLFLDV
jgi:hypothetical protein